MTEREAMESMETAPGIAPDWYYYLFINNYSGHRPEQYYLPEHLPICIRLGIGYELENAKTVRRVTLIARKQMEGIGKPYRPSE
jgi:hypothetical protein